MTHLDKKFHYVGFSEDVGRVKSKAESYGLTVMEKPFDEFVWNDNVPVGPRKRELEIYRHNGKVVYAYEPGPGYESEEFRRSLFRNVPVAPLHEQNDLRAIGLRN